MFLSHLLRGQESCNALLQSISKELKKRVAVLSRPTMPFASHALVCSSSGVGGREDRVEEERTEQEEVALLA